MGKVTIIAAVLISFVVIFLQRNTQQTTFETSARFNGHYNDFMARELAAKARKLVIIDWVENNGATAQPFTTIDEEGGSLEVVNYSLLGNIVDFTVRGEYQNHVHHIRTRLRWQNFDIFGVQFKAADLYATISPDATLDISDISMDDQSLVDLESFLVDELGLISSLGDIGLGSADLVGDMESALATGLHTDIDVNLIEDADREAYSEQDGLFFPDQVTQMISSFGHEHPELTQTVSTLGSLGGTFGPAQEMLVVTGDLNVTSDFSGQGILVIEGNFAVAEDVNFNWAGLIVIKPPTSNLNPTVDLAGIVDITGSLIALQEGVPMTGHMDLSVHRDPTGSWSLANGSDYYFYQHTHNYSGYYGFDVTFSSTDPGATVNSSQTKFDEFLSGYPSNTEIYLSLVNTQNHGRANITVDLGAAGSSVSSVAAGFDEEVAFSPVAPYRTKNFQINQLEHLEIDVTRLSALRKMWDSGDPHPGCIFNGHGIGPEWGTVCVWGNHDRMNALALRIHAANGTLLYEAPLYWHRQLAEEDVFEEEMQNLLDQIASNNYGLNLNIGADVTLTQDNSFVNSMTAFQGIPMLGYTHLGTWHHHWGPEDVGNPVVDTP